jgi:hypothetical protein
VKLDTAIEDVQSAELQMAGELRKVGERHAAEADLYHLGHSLARQCGDHLRRLAPFAERYGAAPAGDTNGTPPLVRALREKTGRLLAGTEVAGVGLMHDLRELYLCAQEAELNWVILFQAARAARDPELIEVVQSCHEQAEARGKWLRTRIKESAPQVYVAG